jgi:hypothetical protein
LRGTERSCPRTTTCGSHFVSRAWRGPLWCDALVAEQLSCPRLKFISTSLGSILPPPNSHVRARAVASTVYSTLMPPTALRLQRPLRLLPDVQNRFLLAERWCFPWLHRPSTSVRAAESH